MDTLLQNTGYRNPWPRPNFFPKNHGSNPSSEISLKPLQVLSEQKLLLRSILRRAVIGSQNGILAVETGVGPGFLLFFSSLAHFECKSGLMMDSKVNLCSCTLPQVILGQRHGIPLRKRLGIAREPPREATDPRWPPEMRITYDRPSFLAVEAAVLLRNVEPAGGIRGRDAVGLIVVVVGKVVAPTVIGGHGGD